MTEKYPSSLNTDLAGDETTPPEQRFEDKKCNHTDVYGSTIILGDNPALSPVCIVCGERFPHWPLMVVK